MISFDCAAKVIDLFIVSVAVAIVCSESRRRRIEWAYWDFFVSFFTNGAPPVPETIDKPPAEPEKLELSPCTFDCAGRTWTIRFTDSLLKKVQAVTGLDLWQAVEIQNSPLVELGRDERKLRDAIWAMLGDVASEQGIDREAFYDEFCGDVFDAAYDAVIGGLQRFFSARRRALLNQTIRFLEELGKSDLAHQEKTLAAGLASMIEAGSKAIESMKAPIQTAMIQHSKKAVQNALQPLSKSEPTSSNAAATSASTPPI